MHLTAAETSRLLRDRVLAPVVRAREAVADGDPWLVEGALEAAEVELTGIIYRLEHDAPTLRRAA